MKKGMTYEGKDYSPLCIILSGPMIAGKSTVAKYIRDKLGRLNTDILHTKGIVQERIVEPYWLQHGGIPIHCLESIILRRGKILHGA